MVDLTRQVALVSGGGHAGLGRLARDGSSPRGEDSTSRSHHHACRRPRRARLAISAPVPNVHGSA
jgi:hypothetical protein